MGAKKSQKSLFPMENTKVFYTVWKKDLEIMESQINPNTTVLANLLHTQDNACAISSIF